jgi:tetratricopeptide (TPR) repeat protein
MSEWRSVLIVGVFFTLFISCTQKRNNNEVTQAENGYSGSESCIECHERFYELWEPSFHGKAMQPIDAAFIEENPLPSGDPVTVEGKKYQIVYRDSSMIMVEMAGEQVLNEYPLTWSLGGKNVFCFLTPLDKGKLQTIPLAYDMNGKTWFNYPESAIRHFGEGVADEALPWKDRMYTFNTGCYNCHVSQLSTNFDLETETYETKWREAGINCETCHGPSGEHVEVCRALEEGEEPEDLKIIVTSTFTPDQHDASCSPCHAKATPVTSSYMPGEPFFDHFDVATLEDPDFYPDGRDLGENYTLTGWMMNACEESSDLNCVTCHTSSGRNRFEENPNDACISCHKENGENLETHTMHEAGTPGAVCVNCHAPTREFVGRFLRSDHSFRPPMPEATIQFGSPNACNSCHTDKSPEWANDIVKSRPNGDYQEETLYWAQLIKEARNNEWGRLDEMLGIVKQNTLNEVVITSFIRLLANCPDDKKWEPVTEALHTNGSPLVRSAAATTLTGNFSEKTKDALIRAADDEYRVVRVSAAAAFASYTENRVSSSDAQIIAAATDEYKKSLVARPDDWSSHYNLGIFHQNQGHPQKALESYETAARLYPEALMPLINSSVLYSSMNNTAKAEENLKKAVEIDPQNEAANLNLGLLLAEKGKMQEAEKALLAALEANPQQAVAAYNLSVIVSQRSIVEAVRYADIAAKARPEEPKYAYTLAYYQLENNQKAKAEKTLKKIIEEYPLYLNAVRFLGDIYLRDGRMKQAEELYEKVLETKGISGNDKRALQQELNTIRQSN